MDLIFPAWNRELTFDINKLEEEIHKYQNIAKFDQYIKETSAKFPKYKAYIKPHETENYMEYVFEIASSELREFIGTTFGIDMSETASGRKRLNEIISKYVETKRGVKTKLNFYQYKEIVLSEELNKFILNNFNESMAADPRKLYEEIAYLQISRKYTSSLIKKEKRQMINNTAYALTLINSLNNDVITKSIKYHYKLFLQLWDRGVPYGDVFYDDKGKEILDIVSYRFRQKRPTVYKYDSYDDVETTNDLQLLMHFLYDIDWWANEDIE